MLITSYSGRKGWSAAATGREIEATEQELARFRADMKRKCRKQKGDL